MNTTHGYANANTTNDTTTDTNMSAPPPTKPQPARTSTTRRCGFPECAKTAKPGGLCIAHGGGKKCSVDGCTTSVVSRGFCVAHGGGKRCQHVDGCTKSAQTGGFCWIHGGGKKCGHDGCTKRAQSGGACISHGGGKRCRIVGCNKVVQYEGLCVGHGGFRKCLSMSCAKKALSNGYCAGHGGNALCRVGGCGKKAVQGGCCVGHRGLASLALSTLVSSVATLVSSVSAVRVGGGGGAIAIVGASRGVRGVMGSVGGAAGDAVSSPAVLRRAVLVDSVHTISPLVPQTNRHQRDWSRAIADVVVKSEPTGAEDADDPRQQKYLGSPGDRLLPIQRPRGLDAYRSLAPTKMLTPTPRVHHLPSAARRGSSPRTNHVSGIASWPRSAASEAAVSTLGRRCLVATCTRFAKVDALCLLHHHHQQQQQCRRTSHGSPGHKLVRRQSPMLAHRVAVAENSSGRSSVRLLTHR